MMCAGNELLPPALGGQSVQVLAQREAPSAGGNWRLEPFGAADWPLAKRLLLACYPQTPESFWDRGLQRMLEVPCGPAEQGLGMLLHGPLGTQGVGLLLQSRRPGAEGRSTRVINPCSWGMLPSARERALWMARHGLSDPQAAYIALTPVASAARVVQRIGFSAVTHQQIMVVTPRLAMASAEPGAEVLQGRVAMQALREHALLPALQDHLRLGCVVLAARLAESTAWAPLVFRPTRRLGLLRTAELVYTPSQVLVMRLMPLLARSLLGQGFAMLAADAHEDLTPEFPCTRLFRRRYARGLPNIVGVDHLYSELVYLQR